MNNVNVLVVFDTNFLIIPSKFKVDIFAACERLFAGNKLKMATIDKAVEELKIIGKRRTKDSADARVALKLIQTKKIDIIKTTDEDYADNSLVSIKSYIADDKTDIFIATMDVELRKRVREAGLKMITLRKKSILQII